MERSDHEATARRGSRLRSNVLRWRRGFPATLAARFKKNGVQGFSFPPRTPLTYEPSQSFQTFLQLSNTKFSNL
ncbi:MAG: hypothetical protein LBQ54_02960, partial [Planctomycetaceae bacterium]|nr:hypothetical protein [Planctomycetaceae bacterium]